MKRHQKYGKAGMLWGLNGASPTYIKDRSGPGGKTQSPHNGVPPQTSVKKWVRTTAKHSRNSKPSPPRKVLGLGGDFTQSRATSSGETRERGGGRT